MFHKSRKLLRYCPACGSQAAALGAHEPVDTNPRGDWRLEIMCGECNQWRPVVAPQRECDDWQDAVLDPGFFDIRDALSELDAERMHNWAATFTAALHSDLIGPDDFLPAKRLTR